MRNSPVFLLAVFGLLGTLGCGDSGASGPVVTVSPASLAVSTGDGTTTFAAIPSNGAVAPATWELTGPGSISTTSGATTIYQPPPLGSAAGTATLRATAGCGTGCVPVGYSAAITINAATTGTLTITVTGVQGALPASLSVSGPAGYSQSLSTASVATLTALAPGAYTVTAAEIVDTTNAVVNSKYSAPPVTATIAANTAASADVVYASEPGYGQLWMPGASANTLEGFTPGNLRVDKSPGVTLDASGLVQGIVFDSTGSMWVSLNGTPGSVLSYAAATLTDGTQLVPAVTLADSNISNPTGIAIGFDGRMWVANCNGNSVSAYPVAGGSAAVIIKTTTSNAFSCPQGLAFDSAGNLWVTNANGGAVRIPNAQLAASFNQATPDVTLTAPAGSSQPAGVALDASGNVWVAFCTGATVARYDANGASVTATAAAVITATGSGPVSLDCPVSLALDNSGELWVGNAGTNNAGSTLSAFAATDIGAGGSLIPINELTNLGFTTQTVGGLAFNPTATNLPIRH